MRPLSPRASLGLDVMSAMAADFAGSDLPQKVDFVDWYSISDTFNAMIDSDKVLLQQPDCRA